MLTENDLINKNLPLVKSIVKKFKPSNISIYKEYEQAGLIGLMKAIRTHDPNKGALSTIAYYYIKGEIIKYIKREKKQTEHCMPTADIDKAYTPLNLEDYIPALSETESKVLSLHLQGHSFAEIGKMLGDYSRGWANNIYRNVIKRARDE